MLIYLLQANICLVLFYLVYAVFLRKHTSHGFNRFYLLSAIIFSILIPWIEIAINIESVMAIASTEADRTTVTVAQSSIFTMSNTLILLYALGVVISLLVFIRKVYILLSTIHTGKTQVINNQKVVTVADDIGICSFFKYIIITTTAQDNISEFELIHEKSHISQLHSIDIIIAWILQSLFWFNPVAYLYKLRLMEVHEFLADEAVIKQVGQSDYQDYILNLISQKLQPKLVHNFNSIIKTRLIMMNSNSKPGIWSYFSVVIVIFTTIFLFSCHAKKVARYTMSENGPVKVTTETVIDTIVTIDAETFKETITYVEKEIYYVTDTIVEIDYDTYEEQITIIKTFLEPVDLIDNN